MYKKDALRILFETSQKYKEELCGKNLLFVSADTHKNVDFFEVVFNESNFLHLTDVQRSKQCELTNNKFSNYSKEFFNKCVSKRLKEEEIEFSNDGKTVLKLSVLPFVVNKNLSAKMYGYYDGSNEILYTEYLLGGVNACMGFIKAKESGEYVPNTLLKQDIRTITSHYNKIIAVYRKDVSKSTYNECVYIAKKEDLTKYRFSKEYEYLKEL